MHRTANRHQAYHSPGTTGRASALVFTVLMAGMALGCEESPTALDDAASVGATATSKPTSARGGSHGQFPTWHQGFNHGTEGWYGEETAGDLGWCGKINHHVGRSGGALPSAGRGYATVELGPCNAFWTGMFGPAHVNGPWAPGLDFALFSESFPRSGFVMELDVYLDPDWTANSLEPGTLNFFAPPDAIFTLAASVRELASAPPTPVFHYFAVPVMPDDCALSILGRSVTEEGWYTFRYVFRDEGGRLAVDFELRERRGGKMFTQPLGTRFLSGLPTSDLATADIGSGYLWFAGLTPDLELPIDEHRIRPGR